MATFHILTEINQSLLTEDGANVIVYEYATPEPTAPGGYSPPVWNTFGNVDKRPWNPRIHWRNFR